MTTRRQIQRRYAVLSALRWLPLGLGLPFLTLLPLARGLGLREVGALFAIHGAVVLACEIPSGALADAVGRRRTLLAGGALTAAGLAVFALAPGFGVFVAAMLAIGFGRSLISGALEAWFVDAVRAAEPDVALREGLAGGLALSGVALGGGALLAGAVPLLFADLPARGDDLLIRYSPAIVLAALAALLYVAMLAAWVHEPPRAAGPRRRLGADVRRIATVAAREARRSRTVRLVFAVGFTGGVALASYELLWQPRLAELVGGAADDTLLFGAVSAGGMLCGSVTTYLSTRVAARRGVAATYVGGIAGTAVMLVLLAAAGSEVAFIAAFAGVSVALGLSEPLHYELLHDAVGDEARATVASCESLAVQLGAVVANVGVAAVAEDEGIGVAWTVAAAVLAGGAVLAALAARSAVVAGSPQPAHGEVRSPGSAAGPIPEE